MTPLQLAQLCLEVYNPGPRVIEREDVEVALLEEEGTVVFRGTDEPLDWKVSFQITPWEWHHVPSHSGYVNSLLKVLALLPGRPKYITGYSKGGALALLYAWHLWNSGHRTWECHIFGSPRVFSTYLPSEEGFWNRVTAWQYNLDPVPSLPPCYPPMPLRYLPGRFPFLPRWLYRLFGFDHEIESYLKSLQRYNKDEPNQTTSGPNPPG